MNDDDLQGLQERLTFQEDLIDQLNASLAAQDQRLAVMERQLKALLDRLKAMEANQPDAPGREAPPPHY